MSAGTSADWGAHLHQAALWLAPLVAITYTAGWALGRAIHRANDLVAQSWPVRQSRPEVATAPQERLVAQPKAAPATRKTAALAPRPVRRKASRPAPIDVPEVLASEGAK